MKKLSVTLVGSKLEIGISGLLKIISVILLGSLLLISAGCKKEGPLEKAGKKIDKAIEKTGDKLEEAGKEMQRALEDAEEKKQ
jgi:hypothetical protein